MALPVDLFVGDPGAARNLKNEDDLNLRLTRDPHGDSTLTFDLCNWTGQPPKLRDSVWVVDPVYGVVWSGYLGAPTLPHPVKGGAIKCVARGWRQSILDDAWDASKVWVQGTRLIDIVHEAMAKCSHIGTGVLLPDLSFQLSQDSQDFINRTPDDVFDFVVAKFAFATTPLVWEIKQDAQHPFSDDPSFHMRFAGTGPRYYIELTDKDEFNPTYDSDTVFNKGIVGWSPKLAQTTLAQPASELYKVIPHVRAKRMNGSVDLATQQEAMNLGGYLVARNNTLRPVNTTLRIHCDTPIRAIWPVVPSETPAVPHHAVLSNYVIRVMNDLSAWGPYGKVTDFWISDVEYDFDGMLTLSLGDPIALDDFSLQQSYNSNRAAIALNSGVVSEPLRDADVVPVIGPDKAGDTPPSIGEIITMGYLDQTGALVSTTDITKPSVPHGGVVHPTIIPDYGVQANFGREANSLGIKGYIRVIPCKLLDWTLDFIPAPGSDSIPTGNLTIELYATYPFTAGVPNIMDTIQISSAQGSSGTFGTARVFAQGGKVGIRVSVAKTDAGAIGFQVGLGGKKLYPHMGVTS